ncbi:MAG: toxin-antitoxin system HicB family antitoxin [Anaerolineaceae bacterium]|nr:toxin-antitoxin system HicB family antitoxin [Anaerolineaceae bacterium]
MNEAEILLKNLAEIPVEEPDKWETAAMAELDKAHDTGEVEKWITLEELHEKTKKANGRIALRIPKDLHKKAIICADEQGVSLNQYLQYIIASEVSKEYISFEKEMEMV